MLLLSLRNTHSRSSRRLKKLSSPISLLHCDCHGAERFRSGASAAGNTGLRIRHCAWPSGRGIRPLAAEGGWQQEVAYRNPQRRSAVSFQARWGQSRASGMSGCGPDRLRLLRPETDSETKIQAQASLCIYRGFALGPPRIPKSVGAQAPYIKRRSICI